MRMGLTAYNVPNNSHNKTTVCEAAPKADAEARRGTQRMRVRDFRDGTAVFNPK